MTRAADGARTRAQSLLELLNRGRVWDAVQLARRPVMPPKDAATTALLAACYRRMGRPEAGLRICSGFLRRDRHSEVDLEFAACLSALGANGEALRRLERVSYREYPGAAYFRGWVLFQEWRFEEAHGEFMRYLATERAQGFRRQLARMYLASTLLELKGREIEGVTLAAALRESCSGVHEGLARVCERILIRHWIRNGGKRDLGRAEAGLIRLEGLEGTSPLEERRVFVSAWRLLFEVRMRPRWNGKNALRALTETWPKGYGAMVRELELQYARLRGDALLLAKVCHASPQSGLKAWAQTRPEVPSESEWLLIPDGPESRSRRVVRDLDLTVPAISGGRLLSKALWALAADLYRPVPLLELHDRIFQGELSSPDAARVKVRQLLSRLRKVLREQRIPVRIVQEGSRYALGCAEGPVRLKIGLAAGGGLRTVQWNRLAGLERDLRTGVTAEEAAGLLRVSRPTAYRLLEAWVAAGRGSRVREARAWRYVSGVAGEGESGRRGSQPQD